MFPTDEKTFTKQRDLLEAVVPGANSLSIHINQFTNKHVTTVLIFCLILTIAWYEAVYIQQSHFPKRYVSMLFRLFPTFRH